ncbi:MAG: flagellar type III secretion system protein FliR [Clostridia bacterium]|nr:flagellar type III secretion system protein FliR [Clostridia bacterium]
MTDLDIISGHLDYMFLLFVRVSGILLGSPIFGRKNVPRLAKIGFCAILTVVFLTCIPEPETYPAYGTLFEYVLICVCELLFGVAMGFVLTTMFNLAMTAGSIIDYQIGFSMASIYDPENNAQTPLSGNFLNIMLLITFFLMDGHLKLIEVLFRTLEAVPVGTVMVVPDIMWVAAEVMSRAFFISVMVAMPVVAAGLMMEIALGAIIKTVPQMNMFVIGIPLKIVIGLVAMMLTLTVFADCTKGIFTEAFDYIGVMFDYLSGAV